MFAIIFICAALFVFGFYYIDTHNVLNSILLGIIGGTVIGAIGSILLPFVQKRDKNSSQKDPYDQ